MRHTQNRRSRGRSRKGPNPLTRSYESNGPDVKVRGTASHVAEKYSTLAHDALVSGDRVSAENYLQHAEHYNRIVAAAQQVQFQQAQQLQQREGSEGGRDDERAAKSPAGDEARNQPDGQRENMDDHAAGNAADTGNESDSDIPAQPGRDAAGGGDDKAERPRRQRRPSARATDAGASDDGSAGTASTQPKASPSSEGEAAKTDAPKPNGRRRKPAAEKAAAKPAEDPVAAEADADTTQDGTAALAAFPD